MKIIHVDKIYQRANLKNKTEIFLLGNSMNKIKNRTETSDYVKQKK